MSIFRNPFSRLTVDLYVGGDLVPVDTVLSMTRVGARVSSSWAFDDERT